MVLFNYATKEITAKIVYYGPGLCGKTTNLQFVYDSLPSNNKSKMLSLATKTDRTLFFDFLPLDLGKIRGMRTKLQLYTVPGQVYYNSTRQLVLKGADGIVFVADSQDFAVDANLESLQNLEDNLKRQGIRIREIPVVMQYNKRDLPNSLSVKELDSAVNKLNAPSWESVATTGIGVEETLKGITQLVLSHLVRKYGLEGTEPLDREIQILNPTLPTERRNDDSVWDDDDDAGSETAAAPPPAQTAPRPHEPAPFVVDDSEDEDIPLVATELIAPSSFGATSTDAFSSARPTATAAPSSPFTDVEDMFAAASDPGSSFPANYSYEPSPLYGADAMEVPMASVEIAIPPGILESLPSFDAEITAPAPRPSAPAPAAAPPAPTPQASAAAPAAQPAAAERRVSDGLVREITLPLNLSIEELRLHKRLKLKITLDVNLLP
jgi:signal recognition particle receptor subunit beta